MKDIIILVADGYQEKLMEGFLPRVPNSSGTSEFDYDIYKHPEHDSGCFNNSHEFLRPFLNQYHYAIVIFDFEGCGQEAEMTRGKIEQVVEGHLQKNGWNNRNLAIVINPEIENWIWIDSPHVHNAINWNDAQSLYAWCRQSGLIVPGDLKPSRPKETFLRALRKSQTSTSSSIYKKISSKVTYKNCQDPAFQKLLNKLLEWFSNEN